MPANTNYVLRETVANLTRNITLTVASILTIFVSLAILGSTVIVRQGASNMTKDWDGGIEFMVYVDPDITADELAVIEQELEENPLVKRIEYVDREATYADFQEIFKDRPVFLENVTAEDLPTRFKVEPTDKSAETVDDLVQHYRKQPNVFDVRAAVDVIKQMKGITSFLNVGLTIVAAVLLVASSLLIFNTIRTAMFARRREIEVMKLVGATNWFIRVPFMVEGMVHGLIGGVLAVGAVFGTRTFLEDLLERTDRIAFLRGFAVSSSDVTLACVVVLVTAVLLSVISAAVATRRFLDV